MKIIATSILLALMALALVGCTKAEATGDADKTCHENCGCSVSLSEPTWRVGTLCLKGEVSQGHGMNKNGQEVAGCVVVKGDCTCKEVCQEHIFLKPAVVLPGQE